MRRNRVSLAIIVSFMLTAGLAATAKAQYLISTKAGFINRVEGKVYILRAESEEGEKARASLGSQMREGDRLSVESESFAETLLNPGSYLRLGENTEIRAVSVALDSVRFELIKGAVIVEIGQIDKKTPIEIITPHGVLTVAKAGLHRIDAKDNATSVAVRQGEIHLGTRSDLAAKQTFKIKSGKVVTLTGSARPGPSDIAKLDKEAIDNFDVWSFNRAEALTAANVRALSRTRTLASGWYYDPSWNFYTYVPTRSWFSSPYGFAFFNNYSHCQGYYPYYYGGGYYNNGGGYYNRSYTRNNGTGGNAASPRNPAQGASPRPRPRLPHRASPGVVSGVDRRTVRFATDRRSSMSDGGYVGRGGYNGVQPSGGYSRPSSNGGGGGGGGFSRGGGGSPSRVGGGQATPRSSMPSAPSGGGRRTRVQ